VSVPGNACDLGLDESGQSNFGSRWPEPKTHTPFFVRYVPHNVDGQNQQDALLALWLDWANYANDSLREK
jgi:hypothetical protein